MNLREAEIAADKARERFRTEAEAFDRGDHTRDPAFYRDRMHAAFRKAAELEEVEKAGNPE